MAQVKIGNVEGYDWSKATGSQKLEAAGTILKGIGDYASALQAQSTAQADADSIRRVAARDYYNNMRTLKIDLASINARSAASGLSVSGTGSVRGGRGSVISGTTSNYYDAYREYGRDEARFLYTTEMHRATNIENAAKGGVMATGLGVVGAVFGAFAGGPAGASVGYSLGSAAGGFMSS